MWGSCALYSAHDFNLHPVWNISAILPAPGSSFLPLLIYKISNHAYIISGKLTLEVPSCPSGTCASTLVQGK